MIPRRIALKGFLCYSEEQVIELDGSDLWVFAGRNGSGKSAVFDAMTYALFGAHRAGKTNAAALINQARDGLVVEFDFELDGRLYRIRRSLRRGGRSGSPERQVYVHEPGRDDPGRWPAVPETDTDAGFKRWVQEKLGLTFETFTSSVLLRQGEADQLLCSEPKLRHEILAGVVDLGRYQRLHEAADRRRQRRRSQAEALRGHLATFKEIEEGDLAEASRRVAEAQTARSAADAECRHIEEHRRQAETWTGLVTEHGNTTRQLQQAQFLLDGSEAIQRDLRRLRDLESVLPVLSEAVARRRERDDLDRAVSDREVELRSIGRKLDLMAALIEDVDRHGAELADEIARDEGRRATIAAELARLAVPLDRARLANQQRTAIQQLEAEATSFAPDPAGALGRIEADLRVRTETSHVLPALIRLARHRARLAQARPRAREARHDLTTAGAAVERHQRELEARVLEGDRARAAAQAARDRATGAATLAIQARGRLAQFEELDGATTCDRCGQPLSAGHVAAELDRLSAEATSAARDAVHAGREQAAAEAASDSAQAAIDEARRLLDEARDQFRRHRSRLERAEDDDQNQADGCLHAYGELPEPIRAAVAPATPEDWLETRYPTDDDLAGLKRQVAAIPALTARRDDARAELDRWKDHQARLAQARQILEILGQDVGDWAALEAEEAALKGQDAALLRCLEGHRADRDLAGQTRQQLVEQTKGLEGCRSERERQIEGDRGRAEALRDALDRARSGLPDAWRGPFDAATPADARSWEAELQALRADQVEAKARELPLAQDRRDEARRRIAQLTRELAGIPPEARCAPARFDPLLEAAQARLDEADQESWRRKVDEEMIKTALEQRRDLERRALAAEREHAIADRLARLLGRDGLQRHLLREAERGILACANPILAELSGDELSLRLLGGEESDPEHALQLEAVVRTHGRTHAVNVAFLSGSQRFRVAVSLALGIGQYARGRHRPIASVIIDEGFGCLDRFGRQEMIAQLNALRGRLARILLVSHQEEFSDAFSDGYRFEVVDGATRVEPFHR